MTDRPLPASIYLDTSIVVAALIDGHTHHAASSAFFARLVGAGTRVPTSLIMRLELSQALAKLAKDPLLPTVLRQTFRLDRWETTAAVRDEWLSSGARRLDALLLRFGAVVEVPFDLTIWQASLGVMARDQLRSHDAIHVATARQTGVPDLATLDRHFQRVRDLHVWLIR